MPTPRDPRSKDDDERKRTRAPAPDPSEPVGDFGTDEQSDEGGDSDT